MPPKKVFSVILVSLLLLNFAGLFLYFPLQLFRIHQEMKARLKDLPDEKLQILILHKNDYQKAIVDEDEVLIDGKMYDVARMEVNEDIITIYAIRDKAEDNLLAFLDEIVKRPLQEKKSPPIQILQFITLAFLPPDQNEFNFCEFQAVSSNTAYLFPDFFCSLSIEGPPPRG